MKKILFFIITSIIIAINSISLGQNFIEPDINNPTYSPYLDSNNKQLFDRAPRQEDSREMTYKYIGDDKNRDTTLSKLMEIMGVKQYADKDLWFAEYIRFLINLALALLGFVALIVLIIWFFKILLNIWKSSEAVQTGKKYIVAAVVSILLIWLSWFIVSFIFNIIAR